MNENNKWGGLAAPLGGLLVLTILAVPAWFAYQGTGANPGPVAPLPTAVSLPDSSLQARWPLGASAPDPVVATPLPAASAPVGGQAVADNCSAESFPETVRLPAASPETQAAEASLVRERLAVALVAGPDDISRAVGRVVQGLAGSRVAVETPVCEGARCASPGERAEPATTARQRHPAGAAQRDALARLALHTRSAEVYAIALQTCRQDGGDEPGSACLMLSADQWARLDPDNAVPWFEVAAQAQQRGDPAALAEAMFRVSKARNVDTHSGQLADTALKRLPAGTPPQQALGVLGELGRLDALWDNRRYQVPLAYCTAARLADANHHQRCSEIAELLLARGRAVQELGVVIQLGERLGWAPDRISAIGLQRDAMMQVMSQDGVGAERPLGCVALRRKTERLREVTQQGERGAARLAMQRSGKSEADLAQQYRERRARLVAAAAAAASLPRP